MSHAQTIPPRRPRLARSIAFWLLLLGSLASLAAGALLTVPNIGVMTASLLDGTATGVEVYAGQAWATLGAALAGAGILGLLLTLALAAGASLIPRAVAAAEPVVSEPDVAEPDVAETADETADAERGDPVGARG
ncbi:dinucleotide-utilizing enzyme [Microbacterium rhizophilus]|uniref:dinucleotide-utilizing enzyme n=1 Tax=Microbacterium rhizophilus TaxID=3138934 RepID=UPI0031EDBC9D